MSDNLLANPGAEVDDPSLSAYNAVTIPDWTVTGTPTVIQYGTLRTLPGFGPTAGVLGLPRRRSARRWQSVLRRWNNNISFGIGNKGKHVIMVVIPNQSAIDAGMRGGAFVATDHYNHYSLQRTIEDSLGIDSLTNNDKYAEPLNEIWT